MKKLFGLIVILSAGLGFCHYAPAQQTTYFTNQYGQPIGSAQQMGNTTYFSNQYGQPTGQAQQMGNTTYFSNQYGQPIGQVQQPLAPIQPYQQPNYITPYRPIR